MKITTYKSVIEAMYRSDLDSVSQDWIIEKLEKLQKLEATQQSMHVDSAIAVDGHVFLLTVVKVGDDVVPSPPRQRPFGGTEIRR